MGTDYSVLHASDLAVYLPHQSRCMVALNPALEWDTSTYLLAEMVNMQMLNLWAQTKDGQKGRNRPKMIEPPGLKSPVQNQQPKLNAGDYRRQLQQPRKGV